MSKLQAMNIKWNTACENSRLLNYYTKFLVAAVIWGYVCDDDDSDVVKNQVAVIAVWTNYIFKDVLGLKSAL